MLGEPRTERLQSLRIEVAAWPAINEGNNTKAEIPPLDGVPGVMTLVTELMGVRALPLPMHSTSGAWSAETLGPRRRWS